MAQLMEGGQARANHSVNRTTAVPSGGDSGSVGLMHAGKDDNTFGPWANAVEQPTGKKAGTAKQGVAIPVRDVLKSDLAAADGKAAAGSGGGAVTAGQHKVWAPEADTPIANLFLTMLHAAGAEEASFGDSTGLLDLS